MFIRRGFSWATINVQEKGLHPTNVFNLAVVFGFKFTKRKECVVFVFYILLSLRLHFFECLMKSLLNRIVLINTYNAIPAVLTGYYAP